MKVVFTSFGSTGDVQPFLALAAEFRRHGHHAVVAFSPNFRSRAEALKLDFVPIGPELDTALIRGVGAELVRLEDPAQQVRHFLEAVTPHVPRMYRELAALCSTADALVSAPFQIVAPMVHEKFGIPYISIHMSQFGALGTKAIKGISARMINKSRASQGLGPVEDPLGADGTSRDLALYAVSSRILRRPLNWPAHHHVVGFFYLEEENWTPPADLRAFVERPQKPIVISFGSMVHADPAAVTNLVVEALKNVDQPAIVQRGWSGLGNVTLPEHVLAADFVPHSWLFPRAACVVHHGGAGTTAAAFKAGVPSIVVPHTLDQPIWGQLARAFGCAAAVIPFAQLTAGALSEALREVVENPRYARGASLLGGQINAENGVEVARRLIEQLVAERTQRSA